MTTQEAIIEIKKCRGNAEAKLMAIKALQAQAFADKCDSMRKAVADAQDTMP